MDSVEAAELARGSVMVSEVKYSPLCPMCLSVSWEAKQVTVREQVVRVEHKCTRCSARWTNVYELAWMDIGDYPEKDDPVFI